MIKVLIFFVTLLVLYSNSAYALVVAPLFIIPVLKVSVFIAGIIWVPISAIISSLKSKTKKEKIILATSSLVVMFITIYGLLQLTNFLFSPTSSPELLNLIEITLVIFLGGVIPATIVSHFIKPYTKLREKIFLGICFALISAGLLGVVIWLASIY